MDYRLIYGILTQVATYKILDLQTPFFIENDPFSKDFVKQTVSLRPHMHHNCQFSVDLKVAGTRRVPSALSCVRHQINGMNAIGRIRVWYSP